MSSITPKLIELLSRNAPKESIARQIASFFHESNLYSDGIFVWRRCDVFAHSDSMPVLLEPNHDWPFLSKTLETFVFDFFNHNLVDPIAKLNSELEGTLARLPTELEKANCLIHRHDSKIFFFPPSGLFVTLNMKTKCMEPIVQGSRFWNLLIRVPHFIKIITVDWVQMDNPIATVEDKLRLLVREMMNCDLTIYLLNLQNIRTWIWRFYAILGRMLHKQGQFDQWNQALAIVSPPGEPVLITLIKELFDQSEISNCSNLADINNEENNVQLKLCKLPLDSKIKKPMNFTLNVNRKHHVILYGNLKIVRGKDVKLQFIMDTCTGDSSPNFMGLHTELRSLISEVIQISQKVYWQSTLMFGPNPDALLYEDDRGSDNWKHINAFWDNTRELMYPKH